MSKKISFKKLKLSFKIAFLGLLFGGVFLLIKNQKESFFNEQQLATNLTGEASTESYRSVYQFPQKIYYTNSAGNEVEANWTGYKKIFNLDDPIVRCRKEGGTCNFPNSYRQNIEIDDQEVRFFKIFLPPGLAGCYNVVYLAGQSSKYVAVVRLGQPPASDMDSLKNISWENYKLLPTSGVDDLNIILTQDYIGRNHSGILRLVDDSNIKDNFSGGWLYIALISTDGKQNMLGISANSDLDNVEKYMTWFRSAQWDSTGDPVSSASTSKVTPTPSVLPGDIEPVDNPDDDVDIYDYNIFIQNWGKSATDNPADIDKNGKVDIFDYNLLLGNFGTRK